MYAFLQWLWDKATRVYEIIGTLYYRVRDAALHAWDWAVDQAAKAYKNAKDRVDEARTWAWGWIQWVSSSAWSWVQDARSTAWSWVQDALGKAWKWAQDALRDAKAYARALFDDALGFADDLYRKALKYAKALVDGLSVLANDLHRLALKTSKAWVDELQAYVVQLVQGLGLDVPASQQLLRAFLSNPLGVIVAFLKLVFLDLLQFSVAYGLGTVEAVLPPWPDWNEYIGGSGGGIPPAPAPQDGGLVRPIDPLWVSGYTFGPGHPGVDYGGSLGQGIYAAHGGVVRESRFTGTGYGQWVVVEGDGWWSRYAHLSDRLVEIGDQVDAGDPIGRCGCVGNSSCNHLHFELKWQGQFVDPLTVY